MTAFKIGHVAFDAAKSGGWITHAQREIPFRICSPGGAAWCHQVAQSENVFCVFNALTDSLQIRYVDY